MIEFVVTGADHVARALFRVATQVPLAAHDALAEGAQVVESHMRTLSEAGPPGPTGRSHRNRESITHWWGNPGPIDPSIKIGPTSPYGSRLELGFHGTDSLGHHYNQGPRPYVEPTINESVEEVGAIMEAAYEAAIAAALGSF